MRYRFRGQFVDYDLVPAFRYDGGGEPRTFDGEHTCRWFLSQLDGTEVMRDLRGLLADGFQLRCDWMTEDEVLARVAHLLRSGSLLVLERPRATPVVPAAAFPKAPARKPRGEQPTQSKKITLLRWETEHAFCGDVVTLHGLTRNYEDGELVKIQIVDRDNGDELGVLSVAVSEDAFRGRYQLRDVLPRKVGARYQDERRLDAAAAAIKTSTPLRVAFINDAAKMSYYGDPARFDLAVVNHEAHITSDLEYIKAWGGSVVKLGKFAPRGKVGEIKDLDWRGYWWLKDESDDPKYWNGKKWVPLPKGLVLQDSNNFCVGFYKDGDKYKGRYGGEWPDPDTFDDYDITSAQDQATINAWADAINQRWSGEWRLRRKDCPGTSSACCAFEVKVKVRFIRRDRFKEGLLFVADKNIRSNAWLWFLDEPDLDMATHEFGHHLGNDDEYEGAAIDKTLNGDGAVDGIDEDSIMGKKLSKIKKRHWRTVCEQLQMVVMASTSRDHAYEATK
jgi:hypothetical protein